MHRVVRFKHSHPMASIEEGKREPLADCGRMTIEYFGLRIIRNDPQGSRPAQSMATIQAIDEVFLPVPVRSVWRVIADIQSYPSWWPASLGLTVQSAGNGPLGAQVEIAPSRGAPFKCRVIEVEPPTRMVMEYFGGMVSGTGEWILASSDAGTLVSYRLDARGQGWLLNILGRFMNLGAVHSRQMKGVLENLRQQLRA